MTEDAPQFHAMEMWTKFTTMLAAVANRAVMDAARRTDQVPAPKHFEPFVWAFSERGRVQSAGDYLLALQDVQRQSRLLCEFFTRHDVLLITTLGQPPVPLNTLVYAGDPVELRRRSAKFSPYTCLTNATGQPAISLRLRWRPDNLPVGLHFAARHGGEDLLFRLAGQREAAPPRADDRSSSWSRPRRCPIARGMDGYTQRDRRAARVNIRRLRRLARPGRARSSPKPNTSRLVVESWRR